MGVLRQLSGRGMLQISEDGVALFAPLSDDAIELATLHHRRIGFSHRPHLRQVAFLQDDPL
jgi:hypothetical protein